MFIGITLEFVLILGFTLYGGNQVYSPSVQGLMLFTVGLIAYQVATRYYVYPFVVKLSVDYLKTHNRIVCGLALFSILFDLSVLIPLLYTMPMFYTGVFSVSFLTIAVVSSYGYMFMVYYIDYTVEEGGNEDE